jgi:hypothetical protein
MNIHLSHRLGDVKQRRVAQGVAVRAEELETGHEGASEVPNPHEIISLKTKDDFLMHGVVLQNRVFRPAPARRSPERPAPPAGRRAMFHVKRFSAAPASPIRR